MRNPAVSAYIQRAAPFARPILKRIRSLFHRACPGIEESIKWGCPAFERGGIIGVMAAFKAHCRLVIWRDVAEKITRASQLPKNALAAIRAAVAARAAGRKPAPARAARPAPRTPPALRAALRARPKALEAFEALRPSHRREYVAWIVEAKTLETRARRLAQAVAWIAQGKPRYWKYARRGK
jgi:hypothetical protein